MLSVRGIVRYGPTAFGEMFYPKFDGLAGHRDGFVEGFPLRHTPRQRRNSDVKAAFFGYFQMDCISKSFFHIVVSLSHCAKREKGRLNRPLSISLLG